MIISANNVLSLSDLCFGCMSVDVQKAMMADIMIGGNVRTVSAYAVNAAPAVNGSANPAISLSAVICHYFL